MGQFLQLILDNLFKLWPVRIVDADQQGVRFSRGKYVKLLKPGIHLFFPGLQRLDIWETAYQEKDCGVQSLETLDGESVSFSINIGYSITDASLVATKFFEFDSTIRSIARGRLAMHVLTHTFDQLHKELPTTLREMRRFLRNETKRRGGGVSIKSVTLDEFVRAPQLRILSDPAPVIA